MFKEILVISAIGFALAAKSLRKQSACNMSFLIKLYLRAN